MPFFFRKTPLMIKELLKILDNDTNKDVLNVVVTGKTGVGVSSLINLITGSASAPISTNVKPCTISFKAYNVIIHGTHFRLIDTPGFDGPTDKSANITKSLAEFTFKYGIDLVVHCIRDNDVGSQAYHAIRSVVSPDVPIVTVVTALEGYGSSMDEWWSRNEAALKRRQITFSDHACVTTLAPDTSDAELQARLMKSAEEVKHLILRSCFASPREATEGWFP
ncbi:P-loop containing nucleoside triphosphate hydrolase protein [Phlebopus sp. FC_14]|nr:P-loop containing nucleoside triphosphate hydrolase protein [Phlebopus sp. FC_14]